MDGQAIPGKQGTVAQAGQEVRGEPSVGKQEAIEAALCHGWIDGQLNPYDDKYWLIRFTPRSSTSRWSEINRATVMRLFASKSRAWVFL